MYETGPIHLYDDKSGAFPYAAWENSNENRFLRGWQGSAQVRPGGSFPQASPALFCDDRWQGLVQSLSAGESGASIVLLYGEVC